MTHPQGLQSKKSTSILVRDTLLFLSFFFDLVLSQGHESALLDVAEQLKQPEIDITTQVLKQAKRFHATMALDAITQLLQKEIKRVQNYNELMREFPINELLGAAEVCHPRVCCFDVCPLQFWHAPHLSVTPSPMCRCLL